MAIAVVSVSEFNLFKCSHFLIFLLIAWKPKETYTYLYGYCVYNQLQNTNHRCQCKQMHDNYFRITTALCHLTVVYLLYDGLSVLTFMRTLGVACSWACAVYLPWG